MSASVAVTRNAAGSAGRRVKVVNLIVSPATRRRGDEVLDGRSRTDDQRADACLGLIDPSAASGGIDCAQAGNVRGETHALEAVTGRAPA